jgi:hypothetical protein
MSAQGGTLTRRGTIHLPLWPFAAMIVALVTAAIGLTVLRGPVEAPVPVREQAAVVDLRSNPGMWTQAQAGAYLGRFAAIEASNPGMWTQAQAEAYLGRFAAIEASAAAIRELPGGSFHASGRAHEVVLGAERSATTFATGLENPGAYGISQVTEASVPVGLENPGAYPAGLEAPGPEAHRPPVVNGEICGQCR